MTTQQVRRKALRAAMAVTFTIGGLACGPDAVAGEDPVAREDATASVDGGSRLADGGSEEDAGAVADAGAPLGDCRTADGSTDWECCEAQGWQPAAHCTPWGPPAPPAIDPATLAVDARLLAELA